MTEETSDVRARGQESQQQPQEEVTLQTLMNFMREKFEEQKEMFAKRNERFDKFSEKLDSYTEEITLLLTDIREHANTWNDNKNEVQKKQDEEAVSYTHLDVYKRQEACVPEDCIVVNDA